MLLAQVMVGVSIVGAKWLLASIPELTILTMRFSIASILLIAMHYLIRSPGGKRLKELNRSDWLIIICQALCAGAFFNSLLFLGLHYTSANIAGIITSVLPAMVAVFSIIFLKEKLTRTIIVSMALAMLGLMVLNGNSYHDSIENNLLGDLLILASLVPESIYYILAKAHPNKLPIFLVSALMNGINVPIFLCVAYFSNVTMLPHGNVSDFAVLIVISLSSAFFYVFWFLGCREVGGMIAGISTAFMPISTLFMAWAFLSEKITLLQLGGMLLVLMSVVVIAVGERRKLESPVYTE